MHNLMCSVEINNNNVKKIFKRFNHKILMNINHFLFQQKIFPINFTSFRFSGKLLMLPSVWKQKAECYNKERAGTPKQTLI